MLLVVSPVCFVPASVVRVVLLAFVLAGQLAGSCDPLPLWKPSANANCDFSGLRQSRNSIFFLKLWAKRTKIVGCGRFCSLL